MYFAQQQTPAATCQMNICRSGHCGNCDISQSRPVKIQRPCQYLRHVLTRWPMHCVTRFAPIYCLFFLFFFDRLDLIDQKKKGASWKKTTTGWWFGPSILFSHPVGFMSSSQLTFTHIFQRGGPGPPTRQSKATSTILNPVIDDIVGRQDWPNFRWPRERASSDRAFWPERHQPGEGRYRLLPVILFGEFCGCDADFHGHWFVF